MSLDALTISQRTLTVLLPETILAIWALVMITAGAFLPMPRRGWCLLSVLGVGLALVSLVLTRGVDTGAMLYAGIALNDPLSYYARLILLITALIVLCLAHDQVDDHRSPEFFGSLLLVHAGAMLVATSNELVFLFVGLELVSLPTYLLLYLPRRTASTQEAVIKYFYLSIFSSALLLFGMAYLYGMTGLSSFRALSFVLHAVGVGSPPQPPLLFGLLAVLFIMAGLGFRVAAVPFHFYAPDVYQGSPTIIAALLAWVPKAVGFLAMLRLLTAVLGDLGPLTDRAALLTGILAVATMVLGNTVALVQQNLKRLLAYSSIAHAGYLLIGIAVAFHDRPASGNAYLGGQSVLFYLVAYAVMTLGAFGVILALNTSERLVENVDDMAGLGRTQPLLALAMALCLFSLAGIPPLVGFWGKFQIFAAALGVEGPQMMLFRALAVIGVVNAAVGAYYYLRIIMMMYLRPAVGEAWAPQVGWPTGVAIAACAALTLVMGLVPAPVSRVARQSAIAAIATPPVDATDAATPRLATTDDAVTPAPAEPVR